MVSGRLGVDPNREVDGKQTKEYRAWHEMKKRCLNTKSKHYSNYGGRGITICERWLYSFDNFLSDMGKAPSSEYSLDRIDNDLGYVKENCRWATWVEQQNNKRNNTSFSIGGVSKTLPQWCRIYGVNSNSVRARVDILGWDILRALTTPFQSRSDLGLLECLGKRMTAAEWDRHCGFKKGTVANRIKMGWSVEDALTYGIRKPKKFDHEGKSQTVVEWSEVLHIPYTTLNRKLRCGLTIEQIIEERKQNGTERHHY